MTHMAAPAEDRYFSVDGLRLHGRLWRGGARTPVICLPGLTRNERDFSDFAPSVAASGRDALALSLRGRGLSDRDPAYLNYQPPTYVGDALAALDQMAWEKAVFVGTSLGGIVTMLTNLAAPSRVAAAVINDVGPELAPEGIARIAGYVGVKRSEARSLDEAAEQIRAVNEPAFPGRDLAFWRPFAERTFAKTGDGRWVLDYDQAIGRALVEAGPAGDLWPAFSSLNGKPTLIVRGAISDLLTTPIVEKMRAAVPGLKAVDVAGVGHAPTLSEPEAARAIKEFLAAV
ncbi:MAG: alpha/beta hydrolase [Parvularculaceae bacterium]